MELAGEYIVYYKHPNADTRECKFERFTGKCENFVSQNCVFSNELNEMLVVQFKDIVQMKPLKKK